MYQGLYICRRCAAAVHDMLHAVYVWVTHVRVTLNLQQASSFRPPWAAVSYAGQQCQDDTGVTHVMLCTWSRGIPGCQFMLRRLEHVYAQCTLLLQAIAGSARFQGSGLCVW